jgi:hypothetical protein
MINSKASRLGARLVSLLATAALTSLLTGVGVAQHMISSRAGFVNRVDGAVFIQRQDSDDGERGRASLGTQMRDGDRLITTTGRAELLLTPGSVLRLNNDSEVRAVNTALDETRFEMVSGSAIVEIAEIDKKTPLQIDTPQGSLSIARKSLIRLDARANETIVSVRQGEIYLGGRDRFQAKGAVKVDHGNIVRLTGAREAANRPEIAKLDKDLAVDAFDEWSFQRADMLAQANYAALRSTRSSSNSLSYGWLYDPFFNCYTYVPGSGIFYSPYGFYYFRRYLDWYYYQPYYYYTSPYYNNGGGGGGTSRGPRSIEQARVIAGTGNGAGRAAHRDIPAGRGVDSSYPSRGVSSGTASSSSTISAPRTVDSGAATSRGASGGASGGGGGRGVGRP